MALRVASAYSAVSTHAILVVAQYICWRMRGVRFTLEEKKEETLHQGKRNQEKNEYASGKKSGTRQLTTSRLRDLLKT